MVQAEAASDAVLLVRDCLGRPRPRETREAAVAGGAHLAAEETGGIMADDTSCAATVATATATTAGAVGKSGADDGDAEEAATKSASVPPQDVLSSL